MSRCVMLALLASLSPAPEALRKSAHDQGTVEDTQAPSYTTVKGCTCKSGSECKADIGTRWKCDTCKTEGRCGTWSAAGRWDYCDYRPLTRADFTSRPWNSKMDYYWNNIVKNTTSYPEYPLLSNILSSVRTTFDNFQPEMPAGREKMIHTVGSVCKFDLQISSDSPYTGLLGPGTQSGIVRLGGATDPGTAGLTPGLGIKFPRTGVPDGDVVTLYSLALGDQWNFFARNQSNHLKVVNGFPTSVLAAKFAEATDCVFQVGISDLARYSQNGREHQPRFPFKIFLVANPRLSTGRKKTLDAIHAEIDAIPKGTTLYTVYACTKPAGDDLGDPDSLANCGGARKLGEMKTSSQCTTSWYGDASLHIRHQRIEEDWKLDPSLMKQGDYDVDRACDKVQDGVPPPRCGLDGMLASEA